MTDFYQSPGDKLRLEVLLKTLSEGSLNLAILGEDDVVLAHYARRIAQHLRQHGDIEVELWASTDSEKLVKRFNEILSELSLDQALDKAQKAATKRYMIFPDAQAIQDIDLQLLARLVNGFPASNIHVVLLVNSLEPHERKLEAFGKSLMQWSLESENPSPKRAQRIETRDEVLPQPVSPQAPDLTPIPHGAVPTLEETAPSANSWDPPIAPAPKGGARLAWGLLGVLLLSLVLFGFMYQEQIKSELEAMQGYLSRSAPSKVKEPPSSTTPTVGMSSTTQLPVKPDDSLIPEKEALVKSEPAPAAVPPAAPASAPAAAQPLAPVAAPQPEPKPETKPEPKPEPAVASARDDKIWVDKLPAGGWMLQHAAFDTQQEIELFQSKQASFKEGRVLKTKRKSGASYFILVTGPYATRQEAESLMKTDPAMAKSWLRATKSVKIQFQD